MKEVDEIINKNPKRRDEPETGKSGSKPDHGSTSKSAAKMTNMDELYQLVHELKEEDLNYHKNLVSVSLKKLIVTDTAANKLERLSLASIHSLVKCLEVRPVA